MALATAVGTCFLGLLVNLTSKLTWKKISYQPLFYHTTSDDMVKLLPPPAAIMCLAYMSQSLVSCVVGISLAFRKGNIDAWKASVFVSSKKDGSKMPGVASSAYTPGQASSAYTPSET